MKKILNILCVLSYYLLLISFCVLYGTSRVNTDDGKMIFRDNMILICWGFFFLLVLLCVINLIYHSVICFKKRKTEEAEETTDSELIQYKDKEDRYLPYFLISFMKSKGDVMFFSFHVIAFSLYSVLIYFQKTLENRMYYFYVVFLLGVLLFIVLLSVLFLVPLSMKKKEGKIEYEYEIYQEHLVRKKEDKEEILYYSDILKMKESNTSFLILSRDKREYIIGKEKLDEKTLNHLHDIQKEKKYDRLLTIKKKK